MMVLKDIDVQLIVAQKYEGISKQGKPYLFYTGRFLDSEGDVMQLKIGNNLVADTALITKIMATKNKPVTISLSLFPSGFSLKGTVVQLEL
jgi:hypothetical protein